MSRYKTKGYFSNGLSPLSTGYPSSPEDQVDFSIPSMGIEDIDSALHKHFSSTLNIQISSSDSTASGGTTQNVPVIFAGGEKWSMIKNNKGIRDKNGTFVLPIIAIGRTSFSQSSDDISGRGINQKTGELNLVKRISPENSSFQDLNSSIENRANVELYQKGAKLTKKKPPEIYEIISVPTPQFVSATYEVVIWTQYTHHMNQVIERVISSYLPQTKGWKLELDKGYWIIANVTSDSFEYDTNSSDMSSSERLIKSKFEIEIRSFLFSPTLPGKPIPIKRNSVSTSIKFETGTISPDNIDVVLTDENDISLSAVFKMPIVENLNNLLGLSYAAISKIVPDSLGGVFVSGVFDHVNGFPRRNIVHLDSYGNVTDLDFNPTSAGAAFQLSIVDDFLYMSTPGLSNILGQPCSTLVRFNLKSFKLDAGFNLGTNGIIFQVASNENFIYCVGSNTLPIPRIFRIFKDSGIVDSSFVVSPSSVVNQILLRENDIIIGGAFGNIGPTIRRRVAMLDLDGNLLPWDPCIASGATSAGVIKMWKDKVYIAGRFNSVNEVDSGGTPKPRASIARFNFDSDINNDDGWDAGLSRSLGDVFIRDIQFSGNSIYIFGDYDDVDGNPAQGLAKLNINKSRARFPFKTYEELTPNPNDPEIKILTSVHFGGDQFLLGGSFDLDGIKNIGFTKRILKKEKIQDGSFPTFDNEGDDPLLMNRGSDYFPQPNLLGDLEPASGSPRRFRVIELIDSNGVIKRKWERVAQVNPYTGETLVYGKFPDGVNK